MKKLQNSIQKYILYKFVNNQPEKTQKPQYLSTYEYLIVDENLFNLCLKHFSLHDTYENATAIYIYKKKNFLINPNKIFKKTLHNGE